MNTEEIQHEDDLLITNDVARAIEEQELVAYYQPVYDLNNNKPVGAEALVRWTMPDGTVVPAGLFVPSLDRTDTIVGLDWFMAEDVSGFLAEKARDTNAFVPVSLNISTRHAQDADFASKLLATVSWHDLDPWYVCIELPEPLILSADEQVLSLIKSVQDKGFRILADNFASGPDGLERLHALGITQAKVAGSLWREGDEATLKELVAKAAELGIILSAEGVEEAHEVDKLKAAGIMRAQGYHFAQPMDGASFIALW